MITKFKNNPLSDDGGLRMSRLGQTSRANEVKRGCLSCHNQLDRLFACRYTVKVSSVTRTIFPCDCEDGMAAVEMQVAIASIDSAPPAYMVHHAG